MCKCARYVSDGRRHDLLMLKIILMHTLVIGLNLRFGLASHQRWTLCASHSNHTLITTIWRREKQELEEPQRSLCSSDDWQTDWQTTDWYDHPRPGADTTNRNDPVSDSADHKLHLPQQATGGAWCSLLRSSLSCCEPLLVLKRGIVKSFSVSCLSQLCVSAPVSKAVDRVTQFRFGSFSGTGECDDTGDRCCEMAHGGEKWFQWKRCLWRGWAAAATHSSLCSAVASLLWQSWDGGRYVGSALILQVLDQKHYCCLTGR